MYDLLSRTVSQGLQAFLPIAFALAWFRRTGEAKAAAGLRWGMAAAVPSTLVAMYGFQRSTRQSLVEAVLAAATLVAAIWFVRRVRREARHSEASDLRLACAMAATLIIVRQTMEIAVAFSAVLQLRAADPLVALTIGSIVSLTAAATWLGTGRRLRRVPFERATRVFAVLFALQVAFYLFHESAESGLLPWSDALHAATEPYGPDGLYGRYISVLLFLAPLGVAAAGRPKGLEPSGEVRGPSSAMLHRFAFGLALAIVAGVEVMSLIGREHGSPRPESRPAPSAPELQAIAAAPHLLFRHTAADPNYGRLAAAPLDPRESAGRAAAAFGCERVSYAAGHGICLTAERGFFTSYKIVFFDGALKAGRAIASRGSPTRTRVSPDGRVGAVTVFAVGSSHNYASSSFSTTTTIFDLTTGDELGELEQFTTWRDGKRLKAADFNFWGVTFTRDSNVFYATLWTAGTTYLVRGDLGHRSLTVVRDNVECPALSPDNRLIAFKKRVGPAATPWRFYVLDLATLIERPIDGETRSIDDQLEWLDDAHILYGAPRAGQLPGSDVWIAPVDGSGPARIFLPDAESPIVVR